MHGRRNWIPGFAALLLLAAGPAWAGAVKPERGEWDFQPRKIWSVEDAGGELLTNLSDIQLAENGRIYAVEPKAFRILILDPQGRLIKRIGRKGEGPGEFRMLWNLQLTPSRMVVPGMDRMQVFSRDGKFLESQALPSRVFARHWLDDQRFIMVTPPEEGKANQPERIEIYQLKKGITRHLVDVPAGQDLHAEGGGIRLRVRDSRINPAVITGMAGNRIYYGFSGEYNIHSMSLDGKRGPDLTVNGRKRKPISEAAKRRRFEGIIFNGGRMPKEMVDQMVKQIPDQCTYFYRIMADHAGRIWVFVTDMENQSGREVDIFSPDGRYLWHGAINLPAGWRFAGEPAFRGATMVAYCEDEDGEGSLVKYALKLPGK